MRVTSGTSWGIGIIWWDSKAHGFQFLWCDSYALNQACLVSSKASNWHGNEYVQTASTRSQVNEFLKRKSGLTSRPTRSPKPSTSVMRLTTVEHPSGLAFR